MSDASPHPYRVLLSDLDGSDISAEIPYLFTKAGCTVEVFCTADSWLLKGSYTTVWHKTEAKDPKSYAKELVGLLSTHSFDWIVLTNDYALRAINDHVTDDELALRILPISNAKNRPLIGSKAALSTLSALHHISTPPFVVYTSDTDIEQAVDTVGLPLLLKIDRSGGGRGLFFCTDKQMVYKAISTLTKEELHNLVLQKYIVGTNVAVEALYRKGELLAYSHATIHKNAIDEFGVSISRIYSPAPEMRALLREIGKVLSFDGFCSYTFMREKNTGTHFLVEADLRTHAWFMLSQNAGVDFSKAIRTYLLPTNAQILEQSSEHPQVLIRHFFREIRWSLQHVNVPEIFAWFISLDGRWKSIPFHDPKLLVAYIHMYIKKLRSS